MSASTARVGAVIRKELAEFRRNRLIIATAGALPVLFLIGPTISILDIKAHALSSVLQKHVEASLFIPLLVPVLVPAIVRGDKTDVRAGRRPGRRPAGDRLLRLPRGGPAVRPRAPHHRRQAQPRRHRTGHAGHAGRDG
jgi:hypothetical protein